MKAKVIRIGNSKGVRIPKPMLEQCDLHDTVELEVRGGAILIRPVRKTREGWDSAFREMAERGDDALLDPSSTSDWDRSEWRW